MKGFSRSRVSEMKGFSRLRLTIALSLTAHHAVDPTGIVILLKELLERQLV
jgi:hypothetical protein